MDNNTSLYDNLNFGIISGKYGCISENYHGEKETFEIAKAEAQNLFDTGEYDFVDVISWTKGENPKIYESVVNYAKEFTLLK